jgi:hypothetical protein
VLIAGMLAIAGLLATAGPAAAQASCTFNGTPSGFPPTADIGGVTPGSTTVAVSCGGLSPSTLYAVADASPLGGVLGANANATNEINLTMGGAGGLDIVSSDASGNLATTYTVNSATTAPNADGVCPPTKAQVDAGLTNCAVAVANAATGVPAASVFVNYAGQPTPDASTLNLSPASGPSGTTVTVSGSNWWGNAASNVSIPASAITVGGVSATTSSVSVPAATYTPGAGSNGGGGTLTGGSIQGTFDVPGGAPGGSQSVAITEPNSLNALAPNDAPYDSLAISASSPFSVNVAPSAPALAITTAKLAAAHLNQPYSATIAAKGGTTPYNFAVSAGSLPPGLTLDSSSGTISGTPTGTKHLKFTVTVTDASSPVTTASKSYAIGVHKK